MGGEHVWEGGYVGRGLKARRLAREWKPSK